MLSIVKGDISRHANKIKVFYLTPEQKDLLDNHQHALVHGHSGGGKTVLGLHKVLQIIQCDNTQKILLIVPSPHNIRCYNFTSNIIFLTEGKQH